MGEDRAELQIWAVLENAPSFKGCSEAGEAEPSTGVSTERVLVALCGLAPVGVPSSPTSKMGKRRLTRAIECFLSYT